MGVTAEENNLECCTRDIAAIVASFTEKDAAAKQSLQQLLLGDAKTFCTAGIRVLARDKTSAGSRYLAYLLAESKHTILALLDPDSCSLADAMAAAKAVAEAGKKLETALEMALGKALREQSTGRNSARVLRTLDLLAAAAAQSCWNSFQVELMAYPDKLVRSKAALLIGRQTRNSAWLGRRLMDRDMRVQANAVEALWELDGSESKPLLTVAAKSKNNRVAANAALGLYRLGERKAVGALLGMARHQDPLFRISGLWAIAETQDPRFLPFLAERFKRAQGKERLAIAGALSRIRHREKALADGGELRLQCLEATIEPGGARRLVLSLSKSGAAELPGLKASEIAIWEGASLVEDYEVKWHANPALLVTGFVAPRFISTEDAYGRAALDGMRRCLSRKRPADPWRIDRYALEAPLAAPAVAGEEIAFPYDETLASQEVKMRHGCIAEPEQIEKAIASIVPKDRAAADLAAAIERQCEALGKEAGKRHMLVLLDGTAKEVLNDDSVIARLKESGERDSVVLHGVCVDSAEQWARFSRSCCASLDGTFHTTTIDQLPGTIEEIYLQYLNRLDISYALPTRDPEPVLLKICGTIGVGQAQLTLSSSQQPAVDLTPIANPS